MPATLRTGPPPPPPPPLLLVLLAVSAAVLAVPTAARPQQRPPGTPDPGRVACSTPAGRPGTCVSTADARGCAAFPTLQSLLAASPTLCSKDGPYIVYCCPDVARPTKPLLTLSPPLPPLPPPPPAGAVAGQPAGVTVVTVRPTATVTLTQLVTVEPTRAQTKSPQTTKTQPQKTVPKTGTKLTPPKLLQPPPAAVTSGGKVTTERPGPTTEAPDKPATEQGSSDVPGKTATTRRPVTTTERTQGTAGLGKGTTGTVPVTTAKPTTTERTATAEGVTKPTTPKQQGTTAAKSEETTKRPVQTTKSASVTTKQPTTKAPQTTEKDEPTTTKPEPTTKKSAPPTEKPEPTTKKATPTTERPAPTTRKPAPNTPSTTTSTSKPEPAPSRRPATGLLPHRLSLGLFIIPPKRLQAPTAAPAADAIVDLPPPVSPSELPAARLAGAEECGQPAAPWVALVGSRRRWLCAGALLGPRLVLTSARCVAGRDPASLVVRLGESPRAQMSAVLRAVAHPLHAGGRHDLALLLLGGGPSAGGVCLAAAGRPTAAAADLFTLGRGLSPFGTSTPTGPLRRARMSELGATDCDAAYRVLPTYRREFPLGVSATEVCVAAADEDTAERRCPQDRGGPLVAIDRRGRYQLVGLMREAAGCGTTVFPNVYTRLSEYAVWLRRTAAQLAV